MQNPVLIMTNQNYAKMFQCFKTSFQRLSESYYFALYVFDNDLGFWNSPNRYTKNFSIATQKFSIKDSVSCGFGRIYWRNPQWKTSFLCSDFCSKKKVLSKKASWVQSWRLPNVTYWTSLELLRFIFVLRFSEWLWSYKKIKLLKFEEHCEELQGKILYTINLRKKQMEQCRENCTGPKNFDICFYVIFGCYYQSFLSGGGESGQ